MPGISEDSVKEVINIMFFHIRTEAKLGQYGSFPNFSLVARSVILGIGDIRNFSQTYAVNVTKRDAVKLFAFAIPHLIKEIDSIRHNGFDLENQVLYKACLGFMNTVYVNSDLANLPDVRNTCRILAAMAENGHGLAAYAYLKGVHEACLAAQTPRS
jgi:hypothetical protein